MCEPTTIIMGITAAVGAFSAYRQGQIQKDFSNYEARQAEADARAEKGAAQVEAERLRKAGQRAAAEANAAIAGSGQDLSSAGAIGINREITRGAEEDVYFTLLGGGDRAARLNAGATMSRARGRAAAQAGTLSAFAQLGEGAYNVGRASGWTTQKPGKGKG